MMITNILKTLPGRNKRRVIKTVKWQDELFLKYQSSIAHVFLLHGNVYDYVDGASCVVRDYLSQLFAAFDVVFLFDRSQGLYFPLNECLKKYKEVLEMIDNNSSDNNINAINYLDNEREDIDLPKDPLDAFRKIEDFVKKEQEDLKIAVIVDYAETVFPNAEESSLSPEDKVSLITMQRWATEPKFASKDFAVCLITETIGDINLRLRKASSKIEPIYVPMARDEEREKYIEALEMDATIENEEVAKLTKGLMKKHIEDILLRSRYLEEKVTPQLISSEKGRIISQEYDENFEVKNNAEIIAKISRKINLVEKKPLDLLGGLSHIKNHFRDVVIPAMNDDEVREMAPMGILCPGPPGTGKTYMAELAAAEARKDLGHLRMSRILDKFVGTSERNLDRIFQCIDNMGECIVFIDEIEQMFQRQEGSGNPVSGNIFSMLLEFTSDPSIRGKVLFLAATNRPDLIDAALKRPGRFDVVYAFLPPDEPEAREEIMEIHLSRANTKGDFDLGYFASKTEGYTPAEIESVVIKARQLAFKEKTAITPSLLDKALDFVSPRTSDVEFMSKLALQEVSDKELLPLKYREGFNKKKIEDEVNQEMEKVQRRDRIKKI